MADVDIVATYALYNINRAELENLTHRIFDPAQMTFRLGIASAIQLRRERFIERASPMATGWSGSKKG
jgi:hypothetical protein